ncbi:MAG: TonB-dependent receptor plug domain-containing protein [Rickettsiales bacterium]
MNKYLLTFLLLIPNLVNAADVDYTGLEKVFGEPVTMSATGKPQRASDTPVSMEIITADEIRKSGALDIPEILRGYAGMDVSRNFKSHADINIRGYNQPLSNRLLVLVNNRQIYIDLYGMTMWNGLPIQLSEIKQIEVVRGPNSSLFGFNAVSGVINIVTYNPLYDKVTYAEGRAGSNNQYEGGGAVTLKASDNVGVRISGGQKRWDDFSRKKQIDYSHSKKAVLSESFNADGLYKISNKSSLRLEFGLNDDKADSLVPFYFGFNVNTHVRSYKAEYTYDASQFGLWTAQLYRNESSMLLTSIENPIYGAPYVTGNTKNPLNVYQLSGLFTPHKDHNIRLSGEYRNNSMNGSDVGISGRKSFTMDIASTSAMWDWKILDNLSFTNSGRFDNWRTHRNGDIDPNITLTYLRLNKNDYKRNEKEYSFNSSLLYKPAPETTLRLSAARGLHVPSLIELARTSVISKVTSSATTTVPNYGNPKLKTETNTTFELGFEQNVPTINSSLEVTLFHETIKDVIGETVLDPTQWNGYNPGINAMFSETCLAPATCPLTYNAYITGNPGYGLAPGTLSNFPEELLFTNSGKSTSWGTEISAKGKFYDNKFNWAANYTLTLPKDTPNGLINRRVDFKSTQAKHKVNLLFGYTEDPFEANVSLNYVSKADYNVRVGNMYVPNQKTTLKHYYIVNAHLGYKILENTRVLFDGLNLTGKHRERPDLLSFVDNPIMGANKIGTTYIATLKQNF